MSLLTALHQIAANAPSFLAGIVVGAAFTMRRFYIPGGKRKESFSR